MMTHVFNAILAYIIMLAVMQYNWWIFIAVLLGKYYESLLRREAEKIYRCIMHLEDISVKQGKHFGKGVPFDIF